MITQYNISDDVTKYNNEIDKIVTNDLYQKIYDLEEELKMFEKKIFDAEFSNPNERYRYSRTIGHQAIVKVYTIDFAKEIGVSPKGRKILGFNAMFHDISKAFWPKKYASEYKFDVDDWPKVKKHPKESFDIIKDKNEEIDEEILELLLEPIHYHHERWDGKGYYDKKGEGIPFGARIIHVIDHFSAMVSPYRSHKKQKTSKQAIKELKKGRGIKYDPVIVDIFCQTLPSCQKELVSCDI